MDKSQPSEPPLRSLVEIRLSDYIQPPKREVRERRREISKETRVRLKTVSIVKATRVEQLKVRVKILLIRTKLLDLSLVK